MKKLFIPLLCIVTAPLMGAVFAATDAHSKTYWISKGPDDHVLISYDHKRHNMIISVDYWVGDKKGCRIEIENCDGRGAAGRGDIVTCIPAKDRNILGVFVKSSCDPTEDESTVASGSVEYIK